MELVGPPSIALAVDVGPSSPQLGVFKVTIDI